MVGSSCKQTLYGSMRRSRARNTNGKKKEKRETFSPGAFRRLDNRSIVCVSVRAVFVSVWDCGERLLR